MIGSRVADCAVEDAIGEGGFGAVYRGRTSTGRAVAIKVLHSELASTPEAVARFEREIETVQWVRHPNVVQVIDCGRLDDGRPFLVMELLEGSDLATVIEDSGRLDTNETIRVLEQVCDALAAAHERGVVHRDVKASNVIIERGSGRAVLVDFGIAKILAPGHTITVTRQAIGTPAAMAPEQYAGRSVDARTDVYGAGALAYHMLTGEPPFSEESATLLRYLHCHAERPRTSLRAPVPARLDSVIARAMHTDPAQRFPGTRAFFEAVQRALGSVDLSVDPLVQLVLVPEDDDPQLGIFHVALALDRGAACFDQHGFDVEASGSRALWLSARPPAEDATGRARLAAREFRAQLEGGRLRAVIHLAGEPIE
jgi:serine/threonine-protein kinase